ncbi:MAG: HPP family protein [Saprospiraceae bacterium]
MVDVLIQDVMTANPFTVHRSENLSTVVELFEQHHFHHVIVVNDAGEMEGVLSATDIERTKSGATLFRHPAKETYDEVILRTILACDIMTKDVTLIQATDSIRHAYAIFKKNKFHALPIVDKGNLVGIVTPLDLLDHFFANPKS